MTEGFAGWVPDEDASSPGQLAVFTFETDTFAEREAARAEEAERKAQRDRARDAASGAETQAWLMRLRGEQPPGVDEVLGRPDAALPGAGEQDRRRRAREILRSYGLEDVITGGQSGVILDANIGVLEPVRDVAQRSAGDPGPEVRRSLEQLEGNRRWMADFVERSAQRSGRRRPFGAVRRSEPVTCQDCLSMGATPEEAFAIHHPELLPPMPPPMPPGSQAAQAEAERRRRETDRLMRLGYSRETAELSAVPYGEAAR